MGLGGILFSGCPSVCAWVRAQQGGGILVTACCRRRVMTVQMIERELAKRLIYSQRALRLAQGINVEPAAVTRPPAAAAGGTGGAGNSKQGGTELTVLQKMKQFDAARREQWQDQVEVRPCTIPPSVWDWERCIAMSVSVYIYIYLSALSHISETKCTNFTKFHVSVL